MWKISIYWAIILIFTIGLLSDSLTEIHFKNFEKIGNNFCFYNNLLELRLNFDFKKSIFID
jgi:hypothetical protein